MDITNTLNRMIMKFKERKKDYKLYFKTQNIMRNLDIHQHIIKILKVIVFL